MDLKGVYPILATPFSGEGDIAYDDIENLTEKLVRGGVHGLLLFGFASEFYKLTDEEREKIAEVVIGTVNKRIPVVVSITDHSTEVAVKKAKVVERMGADALMILPPFLLGTSDRDVYEHIVAVGEAVNIPVVIQYSPGDTGVAIDVSVFLKAGEEVSNVQYLKVESQPSGVMISEIEKRSEGRIKCFVGNAGFQMLDALERGAVGIMPGCSLFDIYLEIYNKFVSGNKTKAREIHSKFLPLLNFIGQSQEVINKFEKMILKKRGIIKSSYCRKPTFEPDEIYLKLFKAYYQDISDLISNE